MKNDSRKKLDIENFDTTRFSFLHRLFTKPPNEKITFWKSRFFPYLITCIVIFVFPLIIASFTLPTLTAIQPELKLPFLRDWNVLFMSLITMPLLITLLFTERRLIPYRISLVAKEGIIKLKENESDKLFKEWYFYYGKVNLISQVIGVITGIIVSIFMYFLISSEDYWGWQNTENYVNISGWIFLLWQLPAFFFIVMFYIGRGIGTTIFLRKLVCKLNIDIQPFHPDNSGGLSPIAKIGLRNQFVLAAGGLNVILFFQVTQKLDPNPLLPILLIAATLLYIIAGPFLFVGPLLPFRKNMLKTKRKDMDLVANEIRKLYQKAKNNLNKNGYDKTSHDEINRLIEFRSLVKKIPVWPFDIVTLRTFLSAYSLPILAVLITPFFKEFVKFISDILLR